MSQNIIPDASQQLRKVAKEQWENRLEPLNLFEPNSNEYSETNRYAMSDLGKGEDQIGTGDKDDIIARSKLIPLNKFDDSHPYTDPG